MEIKPKIYDAFLFFNELDLLEIRLELLNNYVDYFVISECDYTFSGNKKPFYFEENKEKYSKFLHKIIHIKNTNSDKTDNLNNIFTDNKSVIYNKIINNYNLIKDSAETDYGKPHWCRDYLHREYVGLGLSDCKDNDIIIFSDLDEIPNPLILKDFLYKKEKYCVYMDAYQYYINTLSSTNWMGSVVCNYNDIKDISLCDLRRNRGQYNKITNGGWHLSFMGGKERIKYKLQSYGHQEFNNDHIINNIDNKITTNSDLFSRNNYSNNPNETYFFENLKNIQIDNQYPEHIIKLIKNKYNYLIK